MADEIETLYEGDWLALRRTGRWEYVERNHAPGGRAVVILAVTPDDHILFVEQPRAAVGGRTIEFPAGLVGDVGDDEGMVDTARRELVEETGWQAEAIELVVSGPTSPGMANETIGFVRATGLVKVGEGGGDDTEDITVHEVSGADAPAWLVAQGADGRHLDLKLWTGLWLLDHDLDGSPRT